MIEIQQLTKVYGDKTAVDDLTFAVRPGVVTGFLGPNGAGKSTTMRAILGLDRPTRGLALVAGRRYVDHPAPLCVVGALAAPGPASPSTPATPSSPSPQRRSSNVATPDQGGLLPGQWTLMIFEASRIVVPSAWIGFSSCRRPSMCETGASCAITVWTTGLA